MVAIIGSLHKGKIFMTLPYIMSTVICQYKEAVKRKTVTAKKYLAFFGIPILWNHITPPGELL